MRAKGWRKVESPEKMPVITHGIHMTRQVADDSSPERLTGGSAPANETMTSKLVVDYILGRRDKDLGL